MRSTNSATMVAVIGLFVVVFGCLAVGLGATQLPRLFRERNQVATATPPTVILETRLAAAPGETAVFEPGEAVVVDGVELRVKNQTFDPICDGVLGFELSFYDPDFWSLAGLFGSDVVVSDDTGHTYEAFFDLYPGLGSCDSWSRLGDLAVTLGQKGLGGTDRVDAAIYITGPVQPEASKFIVTVFRAGPIENVAWEIGINSQ